MLLELLVVEESALVPARGSLPSILADSADRTGHGADGVGMSYMKQQPPFVNFDGKWWTEDKGETGRSAWLRR